LHRGAIEDGRAARRELGRDAIEQELFDPELDARAHVRQWLL
jgi:hypothetical protein